MYNSDFDISPEHLAEVERARRQENLERLYPDSGVKYRYSDALLETFRAETPEQERLKAFIAGFIATFGRSSDWFLFLGKRGTGKTHAACTICNELMADGKHVKYSSLPRLLADIKGGYGKGENKLGELIDAPLLVIDELGVIKLSEDDYRNLFILLDERYMEERATILISNAENLDFLGEAILDRLTETAKTIRFEGEGRRAKR